MDKTVLLIDDDIEDHEIFETALAQADDVYKCVSYTDCEVALQHLKQKLLHPAYIFLDLNMPKVNGMECLSEIKSHQTTSTIPVIIYSTSRLPQDKTRAIELGASGFLTKPETIRQLREALVAILGESNSVLQITN